MEFTRSERSAAPSVAAPTPTSAQGRAGWHRYVALGDSFTEGLWDVPGGAPPEVTTRTDPSLACRGWADLLAAHLAERSPHPVHYANLAIRGRLLAPILRDQVPQALELEPDLVSLIGGGNDMLRPAADPDRMAADLEHAVGRLRGAGIDVLLGTGMDAQDSPVVRRTRPRVAVFNAHIWTIARRHGAFVLDVWGMRSLRDWRMWAPDRIHLTTAGHERVAQAALVALGLTPDDPAWDDPLTPLPPVARADRWRSDARWAREYAYPWLRRRLTRRSSGDAVAAKRPRPVPVERP